MAKDWPTSMKLCHSLLVKAELRHDVQQGRSEIIISLTKRGNYNEIEDECMRGEKGAKEE